ncbi:MAG: hypothetical protein KJ607_07175 [Bacteroidetes bacterium]|nr:hypothetical protein [Bacteroidota bacterium]
MKNTALIVVLLFIIASAKTSFAQIHLFAYNPINEFTLEDLWNLNIRYSGTSAFDKYRLVLDVYEPEKGHLIKATTGLFDIPQQGIIIDKFNFGTLLKPIRTIITNTGFFYLLQERGQRFPAGNYRIVFCLQGITDDPATGTVTENLAWFEYEHAVLLLFPPALIQPYDEDTIKTSLPLFVWTPPFPIISPKGTDYEILVSEIFRGQNPYKAIESNPAVFREKGINATILTYPSYAECLKPGGRYAWQIFAYDGDILIGKSEIWCFYYLDLQESTPTLIKPLNVYAKMKKVPDGTYYYLTDKYLDVEYPEEYFDSTGLDYRIYTSDGNTIGIQSEPEIRYGENFFSLDCEGLAANKYYLLEVISKKNEKLYLRFKYSQ